MKDYLQILRMQDKIARAYMDSVRCAAEKIVAGQIRIHKVLAREMKRLSR